MNAEEIWRKRLNKCSEEFCVVLRDCLDVDKIFRIEVRLAPEAGEKQRQKIRQLVRVRSIWGPVIIGTTNLENIYRINDLSFVEEILAVDSPGAGTYFQETNRPALTAVFKCREKKQESVIGKVFGAILRFFTG